MSVCLSKFREQLCVLEEGVCGLPRILFLNHTQQHVTALLEQTATVRQPPSDRSDRKKTTSVSVFTFNASSRLVSPQSRFSFPRYLNLLSIHLLFSSSVHISFPLLFTFLFLFCLHFLFFTIHLLYSPAPYSPLLFHFHSPFTQPFLPLLISCHQ